MYRKQNIFLTAENTLKNQFGEFALKMIARWVVMMNTLAI